MKKNNKNIFILSLIAVMVLLIGSQFFGGDGGDLEGKLRREKRVKAPAVQMQELPEHSRMSPIAPENPLPDLVVEKYMLNANNDVVARVRNQGNSDIPANIGFYIKGPRAYSTERYNTQSEIQAPAQLYQANSVVDIVIIPQEKLVLYGGNETIWTCVDRSDFQFRSELVYESDENNCHYEFLHKSAGNLVVNHLPDLLIQNISQDQDGNIVATVSNMGNGSIVFFDDDVRVSGNIGPVELDDMEETVSGFGNIRIAHASDEFIVIPSADVPYYSGIDDNITLCIDEPYFASATHRPDGDVYEQDETNNCLTRSFDSIFGGLPPTHLLRTQEAPAPTHNEKVFNNGKGR